MSQQVGSTSGLAPTAPTTPTTPAVREVEAEPGGASEVAEADWPEPVSAGDGQPGTESTTSVTRSRSITSSSVGKTSRVRGWLRRTPPAAAVAVPAAPSVVAAGPDLDLASNDPLVGYLLSAASAVDITGLQLESPALTALQAAGVVLLVPLISSGSLVGLLSLGPRRSERG